MSLSRQPSGPDKSTSEKLIAEDRRMRERILTSLQESLLVEAAAGTGKTTVLVHRLVEVLKQGTGIDGVAAVTFTRKAAGELKLRLRQGLEQARVQASPREKANLETAIARLEEARIGTIHSFCAELLRERPVEAGVDPDFQELSEEEAPRFFDQAFKVWIQQKLDEMPEALSRVLTRLAHRRRFGNLSALEQIREAGWKLAEWRDFSASWRRQPFDPGAAVDRLLKQIAEVARISAKCEYRKDYLRLSLQPTRFFQRDLEKARELGALDPHDLEARLIELSFALNRDRRKGRGLFVQGYSRQQVLQLREELTRCLEDFKVRADADLAALLQRELQGLIAQYEQVKRRAGSLDFVDLLIGARRLIRDNPTVRAHLQRRFTHIFVDEFQDTDPLQIEIILLLAAGDVNQSDWEQVQVEPGKLFLVGDPKQSIYRFRRADVTLYQRVKAQLLGAGVGEARLSRNFRSEQPLQEAVNAAFSDVMDGDPEVGQPDYVPLLEHLPGNPAHPPVVALPPPRPYGYYGITKKAVEDCLPDTVAAFLDWLIRESGWSIRDPEDPQTLIPIQPHHISLLFRRFLSWGKDVTRPYVQALDARSLPHLLVGSRSFHQREEVETLLAALTAVEWPDDALSVFATLKASLFAIPDNLLLRWRLELGSLHPFRKLPESIDPDFEAIVQALELLAELHRRRNSRPVVETVNEILEFTRAHAGFAFRPAGDRVLANVQKICDLARRYETSGGISFRGFVERLTEESQRPRSNEAPVVEEGAEGIRMMTLHSAKGLESPVVVLCDITANLASREPDKLVDRKRSLCAMKTLGCAPWELIEAAEAEHRKDLAEGVRIAYVAATRARDLLVVPAVGDEALKGGWVSPLDPVVYPAQHARRNSRPDPRCPEFGNVTVLARPMRWDGTVESSVKPGLHRPAKGRHEVVWWDPSILSLGSEGGVGLRREKILARDEGNQAERGLELYLDWKEQRALDLEKGIKPEFEILTPSRSLEPPAQFEPNLTVQQLERAAGRPGGRRFGILVHTLLRDVTLEPDPEQVRALAKYHSRILKASEAEREAAVETVLRTLGHPLLEQARTARRCHREWPLLLHLKDGRTVEGTIDLAFKTESGWVVVDFKTDLDQEKQEQLYRIQLSWYLLAVSRLTESPTRGVLLGV